MMMHKLMTVEEALRAYAAMINTLDISKLEPYLSKDFRYTSQMVLSDIVSKHDFLNYMGGKLATIRNSGSKIWAEMGIDPEGFPGPCVILSQGEKENLVGVVLATVEADLIKQFDLCIVPTPRSALRTGEYPK